MKKHFIFSAVALATATMPIVATSCTKLQEKKVAFQFATIDQIVKNSSDVVTFAKNFCGYIGDDRDEAEKIIEEFIVSDQNVAYVDIAKDNKIYKAKIKLIGINHDIFADKTITKDCFTYQFFNTLTESIFQPDGLWLSGVWYYPDEDWSCTLRDLCKNKLKEMMPKVLVDSVKEVYKISGYSTAEEPFLQNKPDVWVASAETFFPLASIEANITGDQTGYPEEGVTYCYYNRTVDAKNYIIKKLGQEEAEKGAVYWLRSYNTSMKAGIAAIGENGLSKKFIGYYNTCDIAPAFCI